MKVKDLMQMKINIDVYDNVTEELGIAFCGPMIFTEEGLKHFKEVLEFDCKILSNGNCIVNVENENGEYKKKLNQASELFYSLAGYCNCDDYDKWFIIKEDKEVDNLKEINTQFGKIYIEKFDNIEEDDRIKIYDSNKNYMDYIGKNYFRYLYEYEKFLERLIKQNNIIKLVEHFSTNFSIIQNTNDLKNIGEECYNQIGDYYIIHKDLV